MSLRFDEAERDAARRLIDLALEEDHARDDATSEVAVPAEARARVFLRTRAWGSLAGIECAALTFAAFGADVEVERQGSVLTIHNPTAHEARVRVLVEDANESAEPLGENAFLTWPAVVVSAGGRRELDLRQLSSADG